MAKSKSINTTEQANDFQVPESAKSFKGELAPQAKMEVGTVAVGYFQSMKTIVLKDQNSHEEKDVRVYTFRDKQGKKFAILGRTMLDTAFDEVFDAYNGFPNVVGMVVRVERVEDTRLSKGRTMGNYDITCWEEGD